MPNPTQVLVDGGARLTPNPTQVLVDGETKFMQNPAQVYIDEETGPIFLTNPAMFVVLPGG